MSNTADALQSAAVRPIGIPIVATYENSMSAIVADSACPLLRPGRYSVIIRLQADLGNTTYDRDMEITWRPWQVKWLPHADDKSNRVRRLLSKVS